MDPHQPGKPTKKGRWWSAEEDECVIELRRRGIKWNDISRSIGGRSNTSCRLHYQNYLERRCEWDEESKTRLAILYEKYVINPAYLDIERAVIILEEVAYSEEIVLLI